MEYWYYFDGDKKKISWTIESNNERVDQARTHIEDYYEKISAEQSKYVALHVGIFWGIGRFIIKNYDAVNVMIDHLTIFYHLAENEEPTDPFAIRRARFIRQLMDQRNLSIKYHLIEQSWNKATSLLT